MEQISSEDELNAMSDGHRTALGEVRLNPKLPRAMLEQKAPDWGASCCGNRGCLTLLFPGRSPIRTRCSRCQPKTSDGRHGGGKTPADQITGGFKAVTDGQAAFNKAALAGGWTAPQHSGIYEDTAMGVVTRILDGVKVILGWQRIAPITTQAYAPEPPGTLPACITMRASPFSSFYLL